MPGMILNRRRQTPNDAAAHLIFSSMFIRGRAAMDEQQKQRVLMAVLAFNVTAIGFQFVFNMGFFGFGFTWLKIGLAVVLGAIAAGVAYVGTQMTQ
jgi:hypothetical protein